MAVQNMFNQSKQLTILTFVFSITDPILKISNTLTNVIMEIVIVA